jgi:hypothetical protein
LIKLQAEKMTLQERVAKLEKEVNKPVLSEAEMREQLLEQVCFFSIKIVVRETSFRLRFLRLHDPFLFFSFARNR